MMITVFGHQIDWMLAFFAFSLVFSVFLYLRAIFGRDDTKLLITLSVVGAVHIVIILVVIFQIDASRSPYLQQLQQQQLLLE